MQAAKDTFLKTLASRLAVVNSARTVTLDGVTRPAVLALENEIPMPPDTALETFLLNWQGAAKVVPGEPLMQLDCKLSYGTKGTDAMLRTDCGRILTAMDQELLRICEPHCAAQVDYSTTPVTALGNNIFWDAPVLGAVKSGNGVLKRTAEITLFYFPEAD
jgi:hypothetical protein